MSTIVSYKTFQCYPYIFEINCLKRTDKTVVSYKVKRKRMIGVERTIFFNIYYSFSESLPRKNY